MGNRLVKLRVGLDFEAEAAFLEADIAVAADYQMVEDGDVEEPAGFHDHLSDAHVFIIYMEKVAILEVRYMSLTEWQYI